MARCAAQSLECGISSRNTVRVRASDFGSTVTEEGETVSTTPANQGINLFADSYVPSFFRRLTFTPDGLLLIAPTGNHRPPVSAGGTASAKTNTSSNNNSNSKSTASNNTAASLPSGTNKSFCTHIFSRHQLTTPCLSLVGLDEPSIAVRCCPRLFKLVENGGEPLIKGDYRVIFAVVTTKVILIYDTQHTAPLAAFANLHLAPINDCAWSGDGRLLVACSSDGYLTFVRFSEGSLGEMITDSAVPEAVRRTHPCLYNYVPPVVAPSVAAANSAALGLLNNTSSGSSSSSSSSSSSA
eukprot:gene41075-50830_t